MNINNFMRELKIIGAIAILSLIGAFVAFVFGFNVLGANYEEEFPLVLPYGLAFGALLAALLMTRNIYPQGSHIGALIGAFVTAMVSATVFSSSPSIGIVSGIGLLLLFLPAIGTYIGLHLHSSRA